MKKVIRYYRNEQSGREKLFSLLIIILPLLFISVTHAAVLTLPSSLKSIEKEAFMGDTALDSIVLPDGIEFIGERAFSNSSLTEIYLPNSLQTIADNAFDNHIPALIIKGETGSLAETYARSHDILFVATNTEASVVLTKSWDEFASASCEMIQSYSASVYISSSDSDYLTGRLIVKTDVLPDVSQFNVAAIVRDPDNHYLLQFLSDIDAANCANYLVSQQDIVYAEPDAITSGNDDVGVYGTEVQSNSWGVAATYADKYAADLKARGITSSITVAVVDTGVDSTHPMLNGRLASGYDFVQNDTTPQDGHGHGTHVSGTIVDCTPGLNIVVMPVRVLGNNGRGTFSCVGQGIRYAARSGAAVINLSLGGGHSSYIDEAIEYALNQGATVVVAAGNDSDNTANYCPAHISGCITVSAVNSSKQKASFSNYGSAVDIAAPGVSIKSSVPGGGYETWNGTSMAAPHVSAAAAMLHLDHYSNVESLLINAAEDLGATGWDSYYGAGFLCLRPFIKGQEEYTITYDANGGSGTPDSQKKTKGETIIISSTKPTRFHIVSFNDNAGTTSLRTMYCTFIKWNTKADGSGTNYASGASYPEDESVTLFAQWRLPTIGTLPEPTRNGYAFDGWYTSSTGGTKISNTTIISNDVTFYAHWTRMTYTISYNANGGTVAPASQTKPHGTAIALTTSTPTRSYLVTFNNEGSETSKTVSATFSNWNTVANGTGTVYSPGATYSDDSDITLYAQWINATIGSLPSPTRSGCTLIGWFTMPTGGDKVLPTTEVTSDITLYAHWQETQGLDWSIENGVLTISGSGDMDNYNINHPNRHAPWQSRQSEFTSVIIEDGVTTIGSDAFASCHLVTSIEIPNSVTRIGKNAFRDCDKLTSISIPSNVSYIASGTWNQSAFFDCKKLESIDVASDNLFYKSIEGVLYNDSATELICYPCNKRGTTFVIPSSVVTLVEGAFRNCNYLESLVIPEGFTSIGDELFAGCSRPTSISLPNSVTCIGNNAFSGCKELVSIDIPSSVESIGRRAFDDCNGLTSITIPASVTFIGQAAFSVHGNVGKLTSINVSSGNSTYSSVNGILFNKDQTEIVCYPAGRTATSYSVPGSVTTIGAYAFYDCRRLTDITLPNGVSVIDDYAFQSCSSLASIRIPKSLGTIDGNAFLYCSKLTDVYYTGSKNDWGNISINYGNDDLINANKTYNVQ